MTTRKGGRNRAEHKNSKSTEKARESDSSLDRAEPRFLFSKAFLKKCSYRNHTERELELAKEANAW